MMPRLRRPSVGFDRFHPNISHPRRDDECGFNFNREPSRTTRNQFKYDEGATEISPVLRRGPSGTDLRQENVPQNKFLLRIGWGEGGRMPDEVRRTRLGPG